MNGWTEKLSSNSIENLLLSGVIYGFWWIALVWQAGGKFFDCKDGNWYIHFTNPTAQKVFEFWGELID